MGEFDKNEWRPGQLGIAPPGLSREFCGMELSRVSATLFHSLFLLGIFGSEVRAGDWPHYRGPALNGSSTEKLALPKSEPKVLWKAAVGVGSAGVTVSGGRAFTMGNRAGKDVVSCLDPRTGKVLWQHEYPLALDTRMFEGGPATTPTVDGERVYTVSHQGDLFCLDAATGKKLWYKHYQQDLSGIRPEWGFAGSPSIDGKLLLLDVGGKGGSTVALDKTNGETVWQSGEDGAGYASPVVATLGGKRTVVVFKAKALVGLDVQNGQELWRTGWKTNYNVNAATPLIVGNQILISSGYGTGCGLYEISGGQISERWRNKNLRAHITSPVYFEGHFYGIDDQATAKAPLVCLDAKTGAQTWSEKSVAGGSLILVSGQLLILSERGELLIGPASGTGFKPSLRTQVLGGRCWVQPTLANGLLFLKNNQGDLVCVNPAEH